MFTSKQHLEDSLGVDGLIGAFFVDRKVPVDNKYWKGRLLYVAKGTGYLFLPIFFDLQYKCGISREDVLNERYVQLMEKILDSAARYEFEEIKFRDHIANCKAIVEGNIKNEEFYLDLLKYFEDENLHPFKSLGTPIPALNRGDTMLFILCYLQLPEPVRNQVLDAWYALVPSFLLMDDIMDLKDDREKNQENSIADFGDGKIGVEKAISYLRVKFQTLKTLNDKLGLYFEASLERKLQTPYLQSILNS